MSLRSQIYLLVRESSPVGWSAAASMSSKEIPAAGPAAQEWQLRGKGGSGWSLMSQPVYPQLRK